MLCRVVAFSQWLHISVLTGVISSRIVTDWFGDYANSVNHMLWPQKSGDSPGEHQRHILSLAVRRRSLPALCSNPPESSRGGVLAARHLPKVWIFFFHLFVTRLYFVITSVNNAICIFNSCMQWLSLAWQGVSQKRCFVSQLESLPRNGTCPFICYKGIRFVFTLRTLWGDGRHCRPVRL